MKTRLMVGVLLLQKEHTKTQLMHHLFKKLLQLMHHLFKKVLLLIYKGVPPGNCEHQQIFFKNYIYIYIYIYIYKAFYNSIKKSQKAQTALSRRYGKKSNS